MDAGASLKSKALYKLFILLLKYVPFLITGCYIINTVACYYGMDLPVLSNITGRKNNMSFNRGGMRMSKGISDEFSGEHFIPSEAEYIVSEMYHTENGRRYTGEKYDFEKAKEVCERYRGFLPSTVNPVDVYVAINAQYHDYANLFKSWFGDRIDHKVIESAIVFWFKDEDNPGTAKLVNYFREK